MAKDPNIRNIRLEEPDRIAWDTADPAKSLRDIRNIVEKEGQKAIDWYWKAKRWKRIPSQSIQFSALLLTAAAGLVPIGVQFFKNAGMAPNFDSGPLASVFVGIAAALLGLDKAFGYSSGWTRYVVTATSMTTLLHEFRMDWLALSAAAAVPPTTAEQAVLIQRAKDFVCKIQGMVADETRQWATEFQNNMAQMEKDLKAQVDALKAQLDQGEKDREAAAKRGGIELTVTNADKTDGFGFDVVLEGQSSRSADSVSNARVWTRIGILPGQYRIVVNAKRSGAATSTSKIAVVAPGATTEVSATLPFE